MRALEHFLCGMRVAEAVSPKEGSRMNGYCDPTWEARGGRRDGYKRPQDVSKLLLIIGWAEPVRGRWVACARGDTGTVVRSSVLRENQGEAITAARSMACWLRHEQGRIRIGAQADDDDGGDE